MLISIHGRFLTFNQALHHSYAKKINLLDKTFISRQNILQTKKTPPDSQRRTWRAFAAATFRFLATARRRASPENLFHYLARVSPASMHDVISEREEQRRSATRMRWMKSQEGETHGAEKRRRRVARSRKKTRELARRKRGDFTSGRRMKRSWFVSA